MMEKKFAKFFIGLVKDLISDDVEKEKLFESLRTYQSSHDLHLLLSDLRLLLNDPNKLELYEFIRPLILLQHQIEFSKRTPTLPGVKLRTVRLFHHQGESLGFAVRGGFEHNVGIFVSQVTPGSQAERQGLRIGDEIVRVHGFTIAEAIHDDVLNLIKSRDEIVLKVTYIGMLPVKESPGSPVSWQYVESLDENEEDIQKKRQTPDIRIFIDSTGHASIGCSILSESGPAVSLPGIFVEKVRPGSIAEQVGLEPGDQIIEVNETSFRKITWEQAVLALKSSRQLSIVIRKKAGSKLVQRLASNLRTGRRDNRSNAGVHLPPPESPLGLSDLEPIYTTVNKGAHRQTSEASERRSSASKPPNELNELELIEQQLNRRPLSQNSSSLSSDLYHIPHAEFERSHSPTNSIKSSGSSVISTTAEVHNPSFQSSITSLDEALRSESHYPQRSALGGAAALMAERKLHTSTNNTADLLGPPDEYEWSDNVQAKVYKMFSSSILDGRSLCCLSYNKNADLGIDLEGGLGSPLGGKILVAVLFDGGIAKKSGKIQVGDQLMMVNGHMLLGVTAAEAERIILGAANAAKDKVELFYCESTLINDESSNTYF